MKIIAGLVLITLLGSAVAAQGLPANPIQKGTWELGLFSGGGMGLGKSDNTQFFYVGGRAGHFAVRQRPSLARTPRRQYSWSNRSLI